MPANLLPMLEQKQTSSLVSEFADWFPDVPGRTNLVCHDVNIMGATPIKQHPYHNNPVKLQFLRKEVECMYVRS